MPTQYLLDTNICIYITKHQPEIVRQHFEKHLPNRNIFISVITLGELRFGAEKSQNKEEQYIRYLVLLADAGSRSR